MLLRPLWPVVEYIVAYDYIVNELCVNTDKPEMECNGTCYLSKQIAKEMSNNSDNPFQQKQVKVELPQVFEELPDFSFILVEAIAKEESTYQNLFHNAMFVDLDIEPPKVA